MKILSSMLALSAVAGAPFAFADNGTGQKSLLTKAESKFVVETMMDLKLATRLSNQVLLTSTSPKLQFIAKNNVAFYTDMMIDLREFALKNKVDLPTSLDAKHTAVWNRISVLRGADQARAYLQFTTQVDLQLTLGFRHYSRHAKSASLTAFSRDQLSVLVKKQ